MSYPFEHNRNNKMTLRYSADFKANLTKIRALRLKGFKYRKYSDGDIIHKAVAHLMQELSKNEPP